MSGSVPHLPWRRAVPVLAAAVSLVVSGSALAAGPTQPTAKPLWEAYPLETGAPTRTLDPPTPAQQPRPRAPLATNEQPAAPLAVAIFFYLAIATLILGAGFVATRRLRRVRAPRSPGRAAARR
jgi:hypothetical protein